MREVEISNASRFQFGTLKRGQQLNHLQPVSTQEAVPMLSSVLRG